MENQKTKVTYEHIQVKKKLGIYKVLAISQAVLILTVTVFGVIWLARNTDTFDRFKSKKGLPYYYEVMKIIDPLKYSDIEVLLKEDVNLTFNYKKKTWRLSNVYRYDSEGNIILQDNCRGICGELTAYTLQKIRPIFGDRYTIEILSVVEPLYFRSSHYILGITEKNIIYPKTFILDPAFHRYGNLDDYDDYLILKTMPTHFLLESKVKDTEFLAGYEMPLIMKEGFLVGFSVEGVNDKFDKDNFMVALLATKRYKYAGRFLFTIRNNNGVVSSYEDKYLASRFFADKEFNDLKDKIKLLFAQVHEINQKQ
ncbi:MAG: hypothetical protein A3J83_05525 [Elusimicrobia bacterium RIFOXYA2_FULL_40_6]|nr:MAG: hypothetical protein A3J83_05525 [Elusimicrobia bacterium RIFOXYA2_FULL_40_6]